MSPQYRRWHYVIWMVLFGLFLINNPSQPFLVEFLVHKKNLSIETILGHIFPIWTYSLLIVQVFAGLLSDINLLSHKWIIASGVILHICELYMTLFAKGNQIFLLQLSQVGVAWVFASYQSFYALRYHVTSTENYQFITGLTRSAMLLGNVIGALIGQFMFTFKVEMYNIYYVSILMALPCLLISVITFPDYSKYIVSIEQRPKSILHQSTDQNDQTSDGSKIKSIWFMLVKLPYEIFSCYSSNFTVCYWSIFIIVSISIHHLVTVYYQTLFKTLDGEHSFNGFLMAAAYLVSGILSLIPSGIELIIEKCGTIICVVFSTMCGICLFILSLRHVPIILAHSLFIIYHSLFEFLLVIAMASIAKSMKLSRFASLFSVNSILQNIFQMFIQLLIGRQILNLNALQQFRAFGYSLLAYTIFSILLLTGRWIYLLSKRRRRSKYDKDGTNHLSASVKKGSYSDSIGINIE